MSPLIYCISLISLQINTEFRYTDIVKNILNPSLKHKYDTSTY